MFGCDMPSSGERGGVVKGSQGEKSFRLGKSFLRAAVALACMAAASSAWATSATEDYALTFNRVIVSTTDGLGGTNPSSRTDPNTTSSPFGGVGSITIHTSGGSSRCSGAAISGHHVLTAAHCFDQNDDGVVDSNITSVTFNLNFGGNLSQQLSYSSLTINPDFTGFDNGVHDDLAIMTLGSQIAVGVPIYSLYDSVLPTGTVMTLVGYGLSDNGNDPTPSYSVGSSSTVKHVGQNTYDSFLLDDEGSGEREIFLYDFDAPTNPTAIAGGAESIVGPGDSGGPMFVSDGLGGYLLAGINTFTTGPAPAYGSMGGGMLLAPYSDWIHSVIDETSEVAVSEPAPFAALALGLMFIAARRRSLR